MEIKEESKVLGIVWKTVADEFVFDVKRYILDIANNNIISKRTVLKVLSSIYDPLGILSPAIVTLKILFQEVCAMKVNWDAPLPDDFVSKWRKTVATLINSNIILIPRYYLKNISALSFSPQIYLRGSSVNKICILLEFTIDK